MDILAFRLHTIENDLLAFIFAWHGIQGIGGKFFRIFIVRSGIHIIFQKGNHAIQLVS